MILELLTSPQLSISIKHVLSLQISEQLQVYVFKKPQKQQKRKGKAISEFLPLSVEFPSWKPMLMST